MPHSEVFVTYRQTGERLPENVFVRSLRSPARAEDFGHDSCTPLSMSVLLCTDLSGGCGGSADERGHLAVCIPMRFGAF